MSNSILAARIATHLDVLCHQITNRGTGSPGNLEAAEYVRGVLTGAGMAVECPEFPCMDWEEGGVTLRAQDTTFPARPCPFSLPFDGQAVLDEASDLAALKSKPLAGRIVLIHGALAAEPLMPKGFVFYNPDHHRAMIRVLEEKQPAAIIAATGKHPFMAGALYPFPLFEDGDFDLPAVYLKDTDGRRLLEHVGRTVRMSIASKRIPSRGQNVVAIKQGSRPDRIVLTAHIDTKKATPGALDNASGVSVLLAMAELLRNRKPPLSVEIAILNGEDYYAVPGQMLYMRSQGDRWKEMRLAVNVDGVGYRGGKTAYSFYECPEALRGECERVLARYSTFTPGPPWVQGDHSMFIQQGVPAMALTSDNAEYLTSEVIHTAWGPRRTGRSRSPGRSRRGPRGVCRRNHGYRLTHARRVSSAREIAILSETTVLPVDSLRFM